MFGLFKDKEIEKLAKEIVGLTKAVWNILDGLKKMDCLIRKCLRHLTVVLDFA